MTHERLRFAHARGARIEYYSVAYHDWKETGMPLWGGSMAYRVHPEDDALQYGPLSTAMLETTIYSDWLDRDMTTAELCVDSMFMEDAHADPLGFPFDVDGPGEYYMACLFYAEYLADMGL